MEKTAFILYLVSVAFGVLLFGAEHTYAYTFTFLLILLASLFQLKSLIRKNPLKGDVQFHWIKTGMMPLFSLMSVFLILQMIPLPQALVKVISPEAWVMAQKAVPAQEAVGNPTVIPSFITLSPYTYPVRMTLVRWFCYGLFFWGLVNALGTRRRIEIAIIFLICLGCFEVLYGLIQSYSKINHIWWWNKFSPWVTGTYINRNMFAGFLEMVLPLAAGTAIGIGVVGKRRVSFGKQSLRGRLTTYFQRGEDFNKRIFHLFTGVVIGIGLIFSGSRGGMTSGAFALLVMGVMLLVKKGQRGRGGLILILFLIVAGWALKIGVEKPLKRFEYVDASFHIRERFSQDTIDLWQDYLWTGAGGGTFRHAFNKYQSAEDRRAWIRYAHNDWAQLFSEFGIAGAAVGVGGMLLFLVKYLRMWLRRRDSWAIGVGAGAFAGVMAMGLHSYFDFNLHYPANFLTMTMLLAIGLAAIRLSHHGGQDKSLFHKRMLPMKRWGMLPVSVMLVMVVWSGYWTICHFMGEAYCNTVPNLTLRRDPLPPLEKIEKAIAWDPGNAEYRFKLAEAVTRDRETVAKALPTGWQMAASDLLGFQDDIIDAAEAAVTRNPFISVYHLKNGWAFTRLWQQPEYKTRYLPAADIAMERAAYTAGVKAPRLHVEMGKYWTMRSKVLDPGDSRWEAFWSKAGYHFRTALSMDLASPGGVGAGMRRNEQLAVVKEIRDYVWAFYPDQTFLEQAMGPYVEWLEKVK